MKIRISFTCVLAIIISIICAGCTTGSGSALLMNENNSGNRMSASYERFSGYKKTTIELKSGETKDVSVNITSEKGEISLKITHEDGTVAYQGDDMETSDFVVTLDKEGKYTVRIDAKKHNGSYDINW